MRVYGLDPATGTVLHETILEGPYEDLSEGSGQTFYIDGLRNDILVGDGSRIYLGQAQLDNSLVKLDSPWITSLGDRQMGQHLFDIIFIRITSLASRGMMSTKARLTSGS